MMITEFTRRTGFYPDETLYKVIEAHCMDFNGNKDAFCKAYKKNTDGLAEIIQHEADMASFKAEQSYKRELARLKEQLEEAFAALDKELEWKPYNNCGTSMSQRDHEDLMKICTGTDGDSHVMSEEEAKELLADEFGFSVDRIDIVNTVHTYEVNRRHKLREAA